MLLNKIVKEAADSKISSSPAGTTRSRRGTKRKKTQEHDEESEVVAESQDPTKSESEHEFEIPAPDVEIPKEVVEFSDTEADLDSSQTLHAKRKRRKSETAAFALTPVEKHKKHVTNKKVEQGNALSFYSRIFWPVRLALISGDQLMVLKKEHLLVEVASVDPTLLSKPTKPPLLIKPTDPDFVDNLAFRMMQNPIAVVPSWLCVVFGDKGKHFCQKILE